jgi:CMP-N-acetylneuraminic acid synthetase
MCNFVDEVYVSSDDQATLEIARQYGSKTILRPKSISGDLSRDQEFIKHFFYNFKNISKNDLILLMRPTHPLRDSKVLENAYYLYKSSPMADSLKSMKKSTEIPFKQWIIDSTGFATPLIKNNIGVDDFVNAPRQILPNTYYQDGYIDIFSFNTVLNFDSTVGEKTIPLIISEPLIDIDTIEDFASVQDFLAQRTLPYWFSFPRKVTT